MKNKIISLLIIVCILTFPIFGYAEAENGNNGETVVDVDYDSFVFYNIGTGTDSDVPAKQSGGIRLHDVNSLFKYSVISEDAKTIRITGFNDGIKPSGHVDVPEEIDGYTVVSLGNAAFAYNNGNITSITIPDTVKRIDDVNCFYMCKNVYEIILPEEMEYIGTGTFSGCSSLVSVVVPKGVQKLSKMFRGCTSLKEVTIPASVTEIDAYSFSSTVGGTDIMPGVKIKCAIGSYAEQFAKNNGMNIKYSEGPLFTYSQNGDGTITITDMADDVEIIGTLEIPQTYDGKTVTGIGDNAFDGRDDIVSISLPGTVNKIGSEAFARCRKISVFDIPEGVTSLDNTFLGCTSLKTVTIPDSVMSIADETFYTDLKSNGGHPIKRLVIYCNSGSVAEDYAKQNSIACEAEGNIPDAWDGTVDTSWYDKNNEIYYISTPAQLAGLRKLVNSGEELFYGKTINLESDINMDGTLWKAGIGIYSTDANDERSFNGIFEGNNHIIMNFTYNSNAESDSSGDVFVPAVNDHKYHGFFGHIGIYGSVKNLGFKNVNVTAGNLENNVPISVGGIAGRNQGTIQHCYVDNIKLYGGYKAAFCNQNYAGVCATNNGSVEDCFVKNIDFKNIEARLNSTNKAGIAAASSGRIKDCYVSNPIYDSGEGYYSWNDDGSGKDKCPVMFYYDSIVFSSDGTVENVYSTDTFTRNGWNVGKRTYTGFNQMTEKMNLGMEKLTFRTIEHAQAYIAVGKTDGDMADINPEIILEFSQPANPDSLNYETIMLKSGESTNPLGSIDKDDEYPNECSVRFIDGLDWQSEYEVILSGAKDYWNRDIEPVSEKFRTTGEFVCTSFELYENYGASGERKLTSAKNISGPVTAVIKGLKNNGTNSYNAVFSISVLTDDQLTKGVMKTVNIASKEAKPGDVTVTLPDAATGSSGEPYVQAVLYKAAGNVVPLMNSVHVSN